MTDEYPAPDSELTTKPHDVISITLKRRVFLRLIRRKIRFSGTDMIKQDNPEIVFECWGYKPPHILITAKTVREYHCAFA